MMLCTRVEIREVTVKLLYRIDLVRTINGLAEYRAIPKINSEKLKSCKLWYNQGRAEQMGSYGS